MSTEKTPNETDSTEKEIYCPFLKAYRPGTSSLWEFASNLHDKGRLDRILGLLIGGDVTGKQQGLWKALTFAAPDLYNLDKVPGISHDDLFQKHMKKFDEMAKDGELTIQGLVEIKKKIAEEENCTEISDASKLETGLLFLGSGGDLETGVVSLQAVKTFLSGTVVENQHPINMGTVSKVKKMCSW